MGTLSYLGDHQIPNRLDNEHNAVFGNPDQDHYDGLHMIGHAGRHVFQESILSILNGAGIFVIPEGRKANQERNIRDRPNTQDLEGRPLGWKTSDDKTIPTGTKPNLERGAGQYDPLQMFRERLSSSRKESCQPTDQISQQQKQNDGMFQADGNKSSRASVISSSSLQGNYSIPVSKPFPHFGKLTCFDKCSEEYACCKCEIVFTNKHNVNDHLRNSHTNLAEHPAIPQLAYSCSHQY